VQLQRCQKLAVSNTNINSNNGTTKALMIGLLVGQLMVIIIFFSRNKGTWQRENICLFFNEFLKRFSSEILKLFEFGF